MEQFSNLFLSLDHTNKTNAKVEALASYFATAPEKDRLWAIALLSHRRPKRTVSTTLLRKWASETANLPLWFFEETYHIVGDLAEAIALVLPPSELLKHRTLSEWIDVVRSWATLEEDQKRQAVTEAWMQLDSPGRFVFNKLITGGFRMGVSQKLMTRALSKATGIDENILAHRLMGNWSPEDTTFESLVLTDHPSEDASRPYPFFLAHPLEAGPESLGHPSEWLIEHKWDGIRGQIIIRDNQLFIWSRGEELMTDRFPELHALSDLFPNGTVLDGEIMPFKNGHPLPFQDLQTRIGRKTVSAALLKRTPVIFTAYDLLEMDGRDLREAPLSSRRQMLKTLLDSVPETQPVQLSPEVKEDKWKDVATVRESSRSRGSEGLMLKKLDSPYLSGRKRGHWWKWKIDPLLVDGVMIYAQRGHGRRANLYTDFTFAVWNDENELVPFTKAYSGLTDEEFRKITQWVKRNTLERFGPVCSVKPVHVFELAFEGIQASSRHKSGVALRFPRIKRWRTDKPANEANTLEDLKAMLRIMPSAMNG